VRAHSSLGGPGSLCLSFCGPNFSGTDGHLLLTFFLDESLLTFRGIIGLLYLSGCRSSNFALDVLFWPPPYSYCSLHFI